MATAPSTLELILCIAGIYACFLTWEVTRERVTKVDYAGEKFKFFVVLNIAQSIVAAVIGFFYMTGHDFLRPKPAPAKKGDKQPAASVRDLIAGYFLISLLQSISSQVGFLAFGNLDYPTMILGKSCKLVPVMLMNLVVFRRGFPAYKYLVVALITAGVSFFMLWSDEAAAKSANPKNGDSTLFGVGMLLLNLSMDGFTNATQDFLFRRFKGSPAASGTHMMVYMNACSAALMGVYLLGDPWGTMERVKAMEFYARHPRVATDVLLYAATGALGQCFIFHTLERFGSMALVSVTVVRKMLSVLLSIFWYNHHINPLQWAAVAMVFTGIGIEASIPKSKPASATDATKKKS